MCGLVRVGDRVDGGAEGGEVEDPRVPVGVADQHSSEVGREILFAFEDCLDQPSLRDQEDAGSRNFVDRRLFQQPRIEGVGIVDDVR